MAIGDITGPLDAEIFYNGDPYLVAGCAVGGGVYLVAKGGVGSNLVVYSFSVDGSGNITVPIDSLTISDFTTGAVGEIVHVSGNVFGITFMKTNGTGSDVSHMATFDCDGSGNLGAVIGQIDFSTTQPSSIYYAPNVCRLENASGIWVAQLTDAGDDGWLITFNLADDGTFGAEIDTYEYANITGICCQITHIYDKIYAVLYAGPGGYVATYTIQDDGTLPGSATDSAYIGADIVNGYASMVRVTGEIWAVVSSPSTISGNISTMSISNAGAVALVDGPYNYLSASSVTPFVVNVTINETYDGYILAFGHSAPAGGYGISTYEISNAGVINESAISNLVVSATDNLTFTFLMDATDSGNHLFVFIARNNTFTKGYLYTVSIEQNIAPGAVTTQSTTNVGGDAATGNGNVTALGNPLATQHGHCWNTGGTPTISDNKTELGAPSAVGAYTSDITGLSNNTTYFVRAYITQGGTTYYGNEVSFTTGSLFPTDPIVRVTGLVHRYDRSKRSYTLEVILGDVTTDFGLPEWASMPTSGASTQSKPTEDITEPAPSPAPIYDEPVGPTQDDTSGKVELTQHAKDVIGANPYAKSMILEIQRLNKIKNDESLTVPERVAAGLKAKELQRTLQFHFDQGYGG